MAFATFSQTRKLAGDIRRLLKEDPRAVGLLRARDGSVVESHTGGHCVTIARLATGIAVELWLDRYSGIKEPRVWVGFRTSSRKRIDQVVRLASEAGLGKVQVTRTARDTLKADGYWRFRSALSSGQFGVQVLETYKTDFFLGLFFRYPWPLVRRHYLTVIAESANYIAGVAAISRTLALPVRSIGPWNRPDPVIEKRAVQSVRRYLVQRGYRVRSRESERCGYDLHATKGASELHVEVKGASGEYERFFLTLGERRAATSDPDWRLGVVTNVRVSPRIRPLIAGAKLARLYQLSPIQWVGVRRGLTRF